MPKQPIENNVYRHHKGGLYRVLFLAQDSETQEPVVVYVALKDGSTWICKQSDWTGTVETDKRQDGAVVMQKRFTYVPTETAPSPFEHIHPSRNLVKEQEDAAVQDIIVEEGIRAANLVVDSYEATRLIATLIAVDDAVFKNQGNQK